MKSAVHLHLGIGHSQLLLLVRLDSIFGQQDWHISLELSPGETFSATTQDLVVHVI